MSPRKQSMFKLWNLLAWQSRRTRTTTPVSLEIWRVSEGAIVTNRDIKSSGVQATLSTTTSSASGTVLASIQVTNTGKYDGQEVVQAYVEDVLASVVVPNIQLQGFEKVMIKAGETKTVSIPIDVSKLGVWDVNMKYMVEPGDFVVWVGASSKDMRGSATFTVE
ncbi:hypothetical protein LTR49_022521 [Elasticomyces elasticus]|nr:hypothetical protein LTR49_022521 [Elasticomyces elasticus]